MIELVTAFLSLWMVLLVFAIYLLPMVGFVVAIRYLNKKSDVSTANLLKIVIIVFCVLVYQVGLFAFLIVYLMDRKKSKTAQQNIEWVKDVKEDGSEIWRPMFQTPPKRMSKAEREYYDSVYYHMTHKPYWNVEDDKGAYGEYLIWEELRCVGASSDNCKLVKFLFNAYIPKGDGTTAELDVIMLCPQGIFVFESKNYSGWIFGREYDENWTQTLVGGGESTKNHFYNPVMQNKKHIDSLKRFLKKKVPIWNVVVFSERCELKSVEVQSLDVFALKRGKLYSLVDLWIGNRAAYLSESEIEEIYQSLYPFTQVSEDVKAKHNADASRCM